ncbi:hypothetical protein LIER_23057 [Lithospermum erythrorhizon]|uniref:Glycosyltransferase family 92 protein n=1 Tax=Lithospermum erythrorhizon TaxID=34254 RepID=A0AAV3QW94_LITER
MDSSEQRRKRKSYPKPTSCSTSMLPFLYNFAQCSKLVSLKSLLLLFFSFISLVYLVSLGLHVRSSADFRPVLVVSSFSLRTIQAIQDVSNSSLFLKIEDCVFLPDHVLLFVYDVNTDGLLLKVEELECLYSKSEFDFGWRSENGILREKVLSIDEYDDVRTIVRCPLPPVNYSNVVSLERGLGDMIDVGGDIFLWERNYSVNSWENLAYAATLDGDTVVVFVKGLNLRPDRESDPSQFTCHFGLGNMESDGRRFMFTTTAITAAQEVVRCLLPQMIRKNPEKAQGIRVTVGMKPHVHALAHERVVMPSVAKMFNPSADGRKRRKGKYELCVCTMLWNQASALREWITYHSWLGIERWFIYDNNSDDGIQEAIKELDLEGFNVTRHVWPWVKTQEAGFSHCALRAKHECNWVSFIDVDEYFHFPYTTPRHQVYRSSGYAGQNALHYLVANVTASSVRIAEIRTDCHSFGPSGLDSAPPQGVTVGYTCRLQSPERHKSIIRPDALDATLLNVVHHFHPRKGFKYINLPQSIATINHYKYQVWDVFKTKFYRRVATYVVDWQENQNEGSRDRAPGLGTEAIEPPNWSIRFCEIWDTGLRDIVLANLADDSTGLLPWERYSL